MKTQKRQKPEYLKDDPVTRQALRERINYLFANKEFRLTRARLAKKAGVHSSTISRFLNGETELTADHFYKVRDALYKMGLLNDYAYSKKQVSLIPDALFFALMQFLEIEYGDEEKLLKQAPGLYEGYRQSVYEKNKYACFSLEIRYDEQSHALTTTGFNRIGRNKEDRYDGYFAHDWGKRYIIVSKNINNKNLQLMTLPNVDFQGGKIYEMAGMVLGFSAGRLFAKRVYLRRYGRENNPQDYKQLEGRMGLRDHLPDDEVKERLLGVHVDLENEAFLQNIPVGK